MGVRSQQRLGVGVLRVAEHPACLADLDDPPSVHDRHAVGDLGEDSELMCHEQDREIKLVTQVEEQVQQLRLDGNVERTDRLVSDQQLGPDRERTRNGDSLALAA